MDEDHFDGTSKGEGQSIIEKTKKNNIYMPRSTGVTREEFLAHVASRVGDDGSSEISALFPICCPRCNRRFTLKTATMLKRGVIIEAHRLSLKWTDMLDRQSLFPNNDDMEVVDGEVLLNSVQQTYEPSYLQYTKKIWESAGIKSTCCIIEIMTFVPADNIKMSYNDANRWEPSDFMFHHTVKMINNAPSSPSSSSSTSKDSPKTISTSFVPSETGRLYSTIGRSFYER